MTTAELIASKLYYADIKQLLGNKAWILGYFISEIIAFWEKMVIFDNKTLFCMIFSQTICNVKKLASTYYILFAC